MATRSKMAMFFKIKEIDVILVFSDYFDTTIKLCKL
jgi:hypothetical protein